ncbi:ImmA/IrrE family metallo-endopeptidase [Nocardia sp. AG03]|uniref:ImmA/IrrE family metallo-endopeptidase n=1 Tax=Nocardia sp. AG03 TaxID=3025312 RepID=UPI0024186117|nr:ImmA/IrrE family metallo-endopeptidase [Nocardia sp. AG03]
MTGVFTGSTVHAAVDRIFTTATVEESRSLPGLVAAIARDRGRPLRLVEDAALPTGVFGQWVHFPDHDEVSVASWVQTRDRTIAHELGHIVLGHRGRPVVDLARTMLPDSVHDMAALMLRRECGNAGAAEEESAAEQFASLLLTRLRTMGGRRPRLRSRWGEALG